MKRKTYDSQLSLAQRKVALWALVAFVFQSLFAQGTMAGSGSWAELCSADLASAKIIYLDEDSLPTNHHDQQCSFSSGLSAALDHSFSLDLEPFQADTYLPKSTLSALPGTPRNHPARAPPLEP